MKLEDMRKNAREGRPLAATKPSPELDQKFAGALAAMKGDPMAFARFMGVDTGKLALFKDFITKEERKDISQYQAKVCSPYRYKLATPAIYTVGA